MVSHEEAFVTSEMKSEDKFIRLIKSFHDHCIVSEGKKECKKSPVFSSNVYEDLHNQNVEDHLFPEHAPQNACFGLDPNTSFGIDCRHSNADYQVTIPGKVTLLEENSDFAVMEPSCYAVSLYDAVETSAYKFSSSHRLIRSPADILTSLKEKNATVISLSSSDDEEFESESGLFLIDLCSSSTDSS